MSDVDPVEVTRANLRILVEEVRSTGEGGPWTKRFNAGMIAMFRATGGELSGDFEHIDILLLTTKGAKSGLDHTTPVAYVSIDGRLIVVASLAGSPKNPAWYHNLLANPIVTVELKTEIFCAKAVVIRGNERVELFERLPRPFHRYQDMTKREIPVIELCRQGEWVS